VLGRHLLAQDRPQLGVERAGGESVRAVVPISLAKILGHRRNIERYCRLLATELTDLERQYLHKRIAEEHVQLERFEKSQPA
jgi:hypothetical protein